MRQQPGYKKTRFAERIYQASQAANAFSRTYTIFGGTGAVGGTAIMKMLEIFEEMMYYRPPAP
ncbi:MAG: hypothetical protein AB1489_02890, partial [Acidobacteriota bacterium]